MIIVEKDDMQKRLETIERITIALKEYWRQNSEIEFKDIIEMVRVELDIENIEEITDDLMEKFLIDNINNDDYDD